MGREDGLITHDLIVQIVYLNLMNLNISCHVNIYCVGIHVMIFTTMASVFKKAEVAFICCTWKLIYSLTSRLAFNTVTNESVSCTVFIYTTT